MSRFESAVLLWDLELIQQTERIMASEDTKVFYLCYMEAFLCFAMICIVGFLM